MDWNDMKWWHWVLFVLLFAAIAAAGFALDIAWIRWVAN